jgi:hypothetical protein
MDPHANECKDPSTNSSAHINWYGSTTKPIVWICGLVGVCPWATLTWCTYLFWLFSRMITTIVIKKFCRPNRPTSGISTTSKWTAPTATNNRIKTHVPWILEWPRLMCSHPLSQYQYHNIHWATCPLAIANKAHTHIWCHMGCQHTTLHYQCSMGMPPRWVDIPPTANLLHLGHQPQFRCPCHTQTPHHLWAPLSIMGDWQRGRDVWTPVHVFKTQKDCGTMCCDHDNVTPPPFPNHSKLRMPNFEMNSWTFKKSKSSSDTTWSVCDLNVTN